MWLAVEAVKLTEDYGCWEIKQVFSDSVQRNNWGQEIGREILDSSLGYVTAFQPTPDGELFLKFYRPGWDFSRDEREVTDAEGDQFTLSATTHTNATEEMVATVLGKLSGLLPESRPKPAGDDAARKPGQSKSPEILSESIEDPTGGKYGTCRDLTIDDVRDIVRRCRAFQEIGGKVPEFYRREDINPGEPRSYELETLRSWLKKTNFSPKHT
jgi:hypothetical protein